MVARFTMGGEVAAMDLDNPAEASYAVSAMQLLPNGLVGIMIVAMFASTMSSMDTGLNTTTGNLIRNTWPWLRRFFKLGELSESREVRLCRSTTGILGIIVIVLALMLSMQQTFQLFDAYFVVSTIIGLPVAMPLVVGLFIRRLPFISFFVIFGFACLPSLYSFLDRSLTGTVWTIQDRALWVIAFGVLGILFSLALQKWENQTNRARINELFERMKTPISKEESKGTAMDHSQLQLMGNISLVAGIFLLCLLLFPNPAGDRFVVLFVPAFVILVGLALKVHAKRLRKHPPF